MRYVYSVRVNPKKSQPFHKISCSTAYIKTIFRIYKQSYKQCPVDVCKIIDNPPCKRFYISKSYAALFTRIILSVIKRLIDFVRNDRRPFKLRLTVNNFFNIVEVGSARYYYRKSKPSCQ